MLEPPKMFSDARHTSDVLEIESLAKLVYELDIQMDSNLFQTFETLVELAGTKQFLQTFSRFQYYLLNLKFLQTGNYGLGHIAPFQNNYYPLFQNNTTTPLYQNQTSPSPTSPFPEMPGSSTTNLNVNVNAMATPNLNINTTGSSTTIPTLNNPAGSNGTIRTTSTVTTPNATTAALPINGTAVGGMAGMAGMAGNPTTTPYGTLGHQPIPNASSTVAGVNTTSTSLNTNTTANTTNNSNATGTASNATTTPVVTPFPPNDFFGFGSHGATTPDVNGTTAASLLNTPPNYFPNHPNMMPAVGAYPSQLDATSPFTNNLMGMGMVAPFGMDGNINANTPMLATPLSTESSSSTATNDMDIDYPLATIVESEAEKNDGISGTTATKDKTENTKDTTSVSENKLNESKSIENTKTLEKAVKLENETNTSEGSSSSSTTTTTTTAAADVTTSLNTTTTNANSTNSTENKNSSSVASSTAPLTTDSTDATTENETTSTTTATTTTTSTTLVDKNLPNNETATTPSNVKLEVPVKKEEVASTENNTTTVTTPSTVVGVASTTATTDNNAAFAAGGVPVSMVSTAEMDKTLYPTANGLAGSFPLPLTNPMFPYDDPSLLKRPEMNMNMNVNDMAFHLANGGTNEAAANYPGYHYNSVDKMVHPGANGHLNGQAYPSPATMYNRYGATANDDRINGNMPGAAASHYYNKVNARYEHMNYNGTYPGYNHMGSQHPYVHRHVFNNQTPLHKISLPQQQYHMVKKNSSSGSKSSLKMNEMNKIKNYGKKHSAENKKSSVYQNLFI